MTMISFRADDTDAAQVEQWAQRLGIDRSELLRDALRRHLAQLAADHEIHAYTEQPITDDEKALNQIADWGPAQDWSDWADATR